MASRTTSAQASLNRFYVQYVLYSIRTNIWRELGVHLQEISLQYYTSNHMYCTFYCRNSATAGYFYDTFANEICFYGIYFYRISFYGIYFYKALKFFSIDCTVVRNT
jgi:hypothetical protein